MVQFFCFVFLIPIFMQTITVPFNMSQKMSFNAKYFGSNKLNLRNKINKNYSSRFHRSLQHYLLQTKN